MSSRQIVLVQSIKDTTSKAMKVGSKPQKNGAHIYCFVKVKVFLLTKQKKTSFLKKTKTKLNLGGK